MLVKLNAFIPSKQREFLEWLVKEGKFANMSEAVRAAIRLLMKEEDYSN